MTPALSETLAMIAKAAAGSADQWWIIGSAAVVLHGRTVAHVKDVDLLMSATDASAFLERVQAPPSRPEPSDRFRSTVFGTWMEPPIPVEVMGGFSVAAPDGWQDVSLKTREAVTVGDARVYVPSLDELVGLLRLFGRPKDLERARLLLGQPRSPAGARQTRT